MQICLNRATAGGKMPLEQFVELAANAGFRGADVDLSYGVAKGAEALRDLYAKRNMKFGGWGPGIEWRGDVTLFEQSIAPFAAQAQIATALGIDSCATWILPSSDMPFHENWHFHFKRLGIIAKVLADHGLRFGLEFVAPYHHRRQRKHEFIFTPMQMMELAGDIGPNTGLLVDSFHLYSAGESMEILAQIPSEKIVLVHLNDAPPGPLHQLQDKHRLLPGEGVIDLTAFLTGLKSTGYNGPVSVEVFSDDLNALPPADAARKAWIATEKVWRTAGLA